MSNKIQVFDLSNASDVSLTSTGFKREGDSCKYVCKITDATIAFVGDNSTFVTDKKKQFNTLSITLPKEQRKSSRESLMRRRERDNRTVNTMARSSSK